jgi:ATP-dependent helicase Lhr and Lhr-like helicase
MITQISFPDIKSENTAFGTIMKPNPAQTAPIHPLISDWFYECYGTPTDIQAAAWPKIAAGAHLLITAPTGSGKTLTAFLWSIQQLLTEQWTAGKTRVLYISPLKALNKDIQRNLAQPLTALSLRFQKAGQAIPAIRTATRSGDTEPARRREMIRHPPEILITTPESLNLLLSSASGQRLLTGLKTVILDEIHSVIDSKRGVHLITAIERLVPLSGEFQRIALSATARPLETVAAFIGGYQWSGDPQNPEYALRTVEIITSTACKAYDLKVVFPPDRAPGQPQDSVWDRLVPEFRRLIHQNRSTLLFTNSRKLSEKIAHRINQEEPYPVAYSHHGSLSRELRESVEHRFKAGALKAIVATSSLELGIDIGTLDEVVLIQSPSSITATIQRIGRSGHRVGEISRARLFPTHAIDFLQGAVLVSAVADHDIETIHPVRCPLDVLAQILISMTGTKTWDIDQLYAELRSSYPYHHLKRDLFERVLEMLAGRYAETRLRELSPRLSLDRLDNTATARKGALSTLYISGGTIPDRGYYQLRHQESGARIGELDEEFVWETSIGKVFTIGSQHWQVRRITASDVFVVPAAPRLLETPFWKSEPFNRGFQLSNRMASFLETIDSRLADPDLVPELEKAFRMDPTAAHRLIDFLQRQKEHTGSALPHRHHLLIEVIDTGPGFTPGNQIVLHTLWGGQLNRPYALALAAAYEEHFAEKIDITPGNDAITLLLPDRTAIESLLSFVDNSNLEPLLRQRLEKSAFFSARFRECAGRALLVTRQRFGQRMPLWMSRLKSQKLLETITDFDDFPILLETWRTCLQDEFDLEHLHQVLTEIETGVIRSTVIHTRSPSPMAAALTWDAINRFMYQEDQPLSGNRSGLRDDLIRDITTSSNVIPAIPAPIIEVFRRKRQRTFNGYAPQSARDLIDWVKERLLIPQTDWLALLQAIADDLKSSPDTILQAIGTKLVMIQPPDAESALICSLERLPTLRNVFYNHLPALQTTDLEGRSLTIDQVAAAKRTTDHPELDTTLWSQWLQYEGPVCPGRIVKILGLDSSRFEEWLTDALSTGTIVIGRLIDDIEAEQICDVQNYEMLLRLNRLASIPVFEPLPLTRLQPFLAERMGLVPPAVDTDSLFERIERMLCLSLTAGIWESDILPARCDGYQPMWLDAIIQAGGLHWVGAETGKIAFCFETDLDLLLEDTTKPPTSAPPSPDSLSTLKIDDLLPDPDGSYRFSALLRSSGLSPSLLTEQLWKAVWQGELTNDQFDVLRQGIENRFRPPVNESILNRLSSRHHPAGKRGSFSAWKKSMPFNGNWRRLVQPETLSDRVETEERKKERVRILLERYGIVFRELLLRELSAFAWSALFRTLRLMELSGELLSGCFFSGIPGPQFISHSAFKLLQTGSDPDRIYWFNATDPVSLCGLALDDLKAALPNRRNGTHLVYHGERLVLISERNGKVLTFQLSPDDPDIPAVFDVLRHLLTRSFQPLKRIEVETINRRPAAESPFVTPLEREFEVETEFNKIILYRPRAHPPKPSAIN